MIGDMEQSGTGSREVTLDGGEKYFVSCLHSEASGWDYIKITRWNEVFGILRSLTEWTIIIVAVIVGLMLLMIARSAVSVLRLQRLLQKKAGHGMRQADLNQLKEGFLSDFLHGNKLFTKSQIREKMEKFHFIVSEGKKYFVLILKLEKQKQFKELYGEKGTYDIEFAYRNIFEETYAQAFKITGIINGDYTIEQMKSEHSGQVDFQKVKVDRLIQGLRSGEQMEKVYKEMTQALKKCSYAEYMNAVIWLGITVMRGVTTIRFREEEMNGFLVALSRCEKQNEVDEVKRYIEANYQDPNTTLERLADEFGGSPNYIRRLFKKDTGMSVAEYINEIRLKAVMRGLRETNRPAKEIAEQCGFISSNYFYTYFRKKTGLTPQTYRERCRELKNTEQEEE